MRAFGAADTKVEDIDAEECKSTDCELETGTSARDEGQERVGKAACVEQSHKPISSTNQGCNNKNTIKDETKKPQGQQ